MKKFFLWLLLIIMITAHICVGVGIGLIIGFSRNLPSLEPLEYRETSSWQLPGKVYSDICEIKRGDKLEFLIRKLKRLEYTRTSGSPKIGEFTMALDGTGSGKLEIYLRAFDYPRWSHKPQLIRITLENGVITDIRDRARIESFFLEPELIAELYSDEGTDRELIHLTEVPQNLVNAVLAIEDKGFYQHWGISLRRLAVAIIHDIKTWSRGHGASTITQQLAKNVFLSNEKTFKRKIREALLAIKIEKTFSKDEILERYLNFIPLGRYGSREIFGFQEAAKYYFRKPVWELDLVECALLAGIPRSATYYSPIRHPDRALRRRNLVLRMMLKNRMITEQQYNEAVQKPLGVYPELIITKEAPYFVDYLRSRLEKRYQPSMLYTQGLEIYTTLDMSMQEAANEAVTSGLANIDMNLGFPPYDQLDPENPRVDPLKYPQAALVAIESETGYVRAMVGGRDYDVSQFNRATQAQRQPGSVFKPFVYCAAFEDRIATPASTVEDSPWALQTPAGLWTPRNYTNRFYGVITLRAALEESINVATAKFFHHDVGARGVIELARRMGIKSPLRAVPSLALGSSEVNLFELTSAYSVWSTLGVRNEPILVKFIVDRNGTILEENVPNPERVLDPGVAYQTAYVLQGVFENGTARSARTVMNFTAPAGGKTGTTSNYTDAWFLGFTPELSAGVWVGFDDPSISTEHTGAKAALPIWTSFMKLASRGYPKDFRVPDNIVFRLIDRNTGMLYNEGKCPREVAFKEAFIGGTEPTRLCDAHD